MSKKGRLLTNTRKTKNKRGTASKYMDNTAQVTVSFLEGSKKSVWGAAIIYPRGGYDKPTTIAPQDSVREVVAEVSRIIKDSMRKTKAKSTEIYFKMPLGITTHKLFISYKDIERDNILQGLDYEAHRDEDMNAYD